VLLSASPTCLAVGKLEPAGPPPPTAPWVLPYFFVLGLKAELAGLVGWALLEAGPSA
jgi:hypothetical protein